MDPVNGLRFLEGFFHGSSFFYKFELHKPNKMQIVQLRSFFILENCPSVGSVLLFKKYVLTTL